LSAKGAASFAKLDENTITDHGVPAKLKHFSAQAAMVAQSLALSQGFALCGQQSPSMADMSVADMSVSDMSVSDMSAVSGDLELTPAPAAAGSMATDKATSSARIVRPMRIDQACEDNYKRLLGTAVK
jgi:hypothetical protein